MNISRHRLYAMGEPLGESITRIESGRLICGGGGGGGSSQKNYQNLERLYGIQSDSAKLLYDQANKNLPGAVDSYMGQAKSILESNYAGDQANKAATDMASASAAERAATTRELSSMGVNPSDPRFAGALLDNEIDSAARMAAGKNLARNEAENKKIAVAQDVVGTLTGQSNNASSQLNQSIGGLAALYNSKNQQRASEDAAKASATSNAVGAGMMALSFMKDGGAVCNRFNHRGARMIERHSGLFGSGEVGASQKGFLSPTQPQPPQGIQASPASPASSGISGAMRMKKIGEAWKRLNSGEAGARATDGMGRLVQKFDREAGDRILNYNAGKKLGADQAEQAAKSYDAAAKEVSDPALQEQYAKVAADLRGGAVVPPPSAPVVERGIDAATGQAVEKAGEVATEQAAEKLGEAVVGQAASTGMGAAASAVGAAIPWVGAAYTIGSLLGAWKDGGEIDGSKAQDLRDGSPVSGPGGHTDDLVPALLSDGEHVVNAEASALIGHGELERLNREGLKLRKRGVQIPRIKASFGIVRESRP